MEIVVTARHIQVSDRFRSHIEEKLGKVDQVAPRVMRVDVVVTHESNRRQAKACDRVELTCFLRGTVIRAEACAEDKYASLDIALDKLLERLRRAGDRRRVQRRGRHVPESVAMATARLPLDGLPPAAEPAASADDEPDGGPLGVSPIEVREKVHASVPMNLEQALAEMELVGHDFYLFHDVETDRPSVVYRRRGWSYGVIHLEVEAPAAAAAG